MISLQELSDREELRQLRSRYSHYFDSGNLDGLVDLYTEDAVCEYPRAEGGGTWIGRADIRKQFGKYIASAAGQPHAFLHAIANEWVALTGPDSAEGRWYMLAFDFRAETRSPLSVVGIYDDEYRRVAGAWKIHRARVDFIWPERSYTGGEPGHRRRWIEDEVRR